MKLTLRDQILAAIESIPKGRVFGYADLPGYTNAPLSVARIINQLSREGMITRYEPGMFYCPELGVLGIRPLSESEKIRNLLYRNGKRIAYITAESLYNRMRLTRQIPGTIVIATQGALRDRDLGSVRVLMIKARVSFTESDVPALELLDALTDIEQIPDTSPKSALAGIATYY